MNKQIIIIIVLYIVASLIARRKKQKLIQENQAGTVPRPPAVPAPRPVPSVRTAGSRPEKTQSGREQKPGAFRKQIQSGKNFLEEVIRELGFDPQENPQPVKPAPDLSPDRPTVLPPKATRPAAASRIHPAQQQQQKLPGSVKMDKMRPETGPSKKKLLTSISMLGNPNSVKSAIILKTILDPPRSLQQKSRSL